MGHVRAIAPLPGYRLLVEFGNGSSLTVDLSHKLQTARFAELASQTVFNDVKLEREIVVWGGGVLRMPLFELVDVAVSGT